MPRKQELYDSVLSDLYQGTLDTAAWDRGLTGIAALVGGEGPLLMSSRHDRPALSRYCLYSCEPSIFAQYANFDPEQRVTPIVSMLERDLCLSPRESEVVALLSMGVEPPVVARRLGITLNTLRTHLKASLQKTGCHSRSDLVRCVLGSVAYLQCTS